MLEVLNRLVLWFGVRPAHFAGLVPVFISQFSVWGLLQIFVFRAPFG